MKAKAFTLIEWLVVLAILGVLVALIGRGCSASHGVRVGVITKFSNKGLIHSSWEGECLMGGIRKKADSSGNAVSVANVWEFSVLNDDVALDVNKAVSGQYPVQIEYRQSIVFNPLIRDTSYEVISIKPVEAK